MADLLRDIRLAVDTGEVALGSRTAAKAVSDDKAKLVVVAAKGKRKIVEDMLHNSAVAGIKAIKYDGSAVELGTACGKPYPVNVLAIINPGNSNILNESY